jgi:uncharacterized protein (DUF927 family)
MAYFDNPEKAKEARAKAAPRGESKWNRAVKDVFRETFNKLQEEPAVNLFEWAQSEPTEFYKLASKLIPSEINAKVSAEMTVNWHEERTYEANEKTD